MRCFTTFLLTILFASSLRAAVLYDGALGTLPQNQGWLAYQSLFGGVETLGVGKTTLDTTPTNTPRAGFVSANPAIVLDSSAGYVVNIDMKILAESHGTANRAGVSVIALSSNNQGIELGFWANEIWAQSGPLFTHAEGVAFNPTLATTSFALAIQGTTYALSANGTPILSGSLRDYSSFGFPYNVPDFLFIGDNTGSANGSFELSRVEVLPEPGIVGFGALAMTLAATRRLRARGR